MLLAPVTNWELHRAAVAGYCYAMRHGMKIQILTPYRVSQLQRYGVTVRGNVTSVYPPLLWFLLHHERTNPGRPVVRRTPFHTAAILFSALLP
jgi:hypothetical protein